MCACTAAGHEQFGVVWTAVCLLHIGGGNFLTNRSAHGTERFVTLRLFVRATVFQLPVAFASMAVSYSDGCTNPHKFHNPRHLQGHS